MQVAKAAKVAALIFMAGALIVFVACEQGAPGATGPAGTPGTTGPAGTPGTTGSDGTPGATGPTGAGAFSLVGGLATGTVVFNPGAAEATADVSDYFSGGAGVTYTITGTTPAPTPAGVTLTGSMLTVPVNNDTAAATEVVVQGEDAARIKRTVTLTIAVNMAPTPGAGPSNQNIGTTGDPVEIMLEDAFVDNDKLTYTYEVDRPGFISVVVTETGVTVTGLQSTWDATDAEHDPVTLTLGAVDSGGLPLPTADEHDVDVTVDGAPVVKRKLPESVNLVLGAQLDPVMRVLEAAAATATLFEDPDDPTLDLTTSSDADSVAVMLILAQDDVDNDDYEELDLTSADIGKLVIIATAVGTATLTLTAEEPNGAPQQSVKQVVTVTVTRTQ